MFWIYVFLDSMHVFIKPAKPSTTSNFPGTHTCAFHPVPQLTVPTEHKLAWCCHFKYFQLEIGEKSEFQLQFPTSSNIFVYAYCSMTSRSHWQSRPMHLEATTWAVPDTWYMTPPIPDICLFMHCNHLVYYFCTDSSSQANPSGTSCMFFFFFCITPATYFNEMFGPFKILLENFCVLPLWQY